MIITNLELFLVVSLSFLAGATFGYGIGLIYLHKNGMLK